MMVRKARAFRRSNQPHKLTETDLAQDKMGRNALQGRDQSQVHNQRHAVPDAKQEADSLMESLEKTDKEQRARRDLGKGNRETGSGNQERDKDA